MSQCMLSSDGMALRGYQKEGVSWLTENFKKGHGCILADEMGLGKTCQVVTFITDAYNLSPGNNMTVLIVCPLSVLDAWKKEVSKFSKFENSLFAFVGEASARIQCWANFCASRCRPKILLSTYECINKEGTTTLLGSKWDILVVDEAHRIKNSESLLYRTLASSLDCRHRILLTGTPIQNNLNELYNLLSFINRKQFPLSLRESFVQQYKDVDVSSNGNKLSSKLREYLLRRCKSDLENNFKLPPKSEVMICHGLTALQKKLYKSILVKDPTLLKNITSKTFENANSLNNVLMQLRKCCLHPYLFNGIEPEPFCTGEHLVTASQKLVLLDKLLLYLFETGHKVLVFSQFTIMLDIVQDYFELRKFSYQRLDGSVRAEERFMSIKTFNEKSSDFAFLLSTRAGGQGITLTAADTVIFLDQDFNPQNDLQAAARAHRIGQTKPVKIIYLVCRNSVEEIILGRAREKLKLSTAVIDSGELSGAKPQMKPIDMSNEVATSRAKLAEIVKFGIEDILANCNETDDLDIDFDAILGGSCPESGKWLHNAETKSDLKIELEESSEVGQRSIYDFQGVDYQQKQVKADNALNNLINESTVTGSSSRDTNNKKRVLTEEEKQEMKENAAKRRKLLEEKQKLREEKLKAQKEEFWKESGYVSSSLPEEEDDSEEGSDDLDEDSNVPLKFVSGSVVQPQRSDSGDVPVILHCVDNSGEWGSGGVFTAIDRVSTLPKETYKLAADMEDLHVGDCHLCEVKCDVSSDSFYFALLVCQKRSRKGIIGEIDTNALAEGFKKLSHFCRGQVKKSNAVSVHSPRLGYAMQSFNWYCVERLLKKHFSTHRVPVSVYYYRRRNETTNNIASSSNSVPSKNQFAPDNEVSKAEENEVGSLSGENGIVSSKHVSKLPNLFTSWKFYLSDNIEGSERKSILRYILAYNGDLIANHELNGDDENFVYVYDEKTDITDIEAKRKISLQNLKKGDLQEKVFRVIYSPLIFRQELKKVK